MYCTCVREVFNDLSRSDEAAVSQPLRRQLFCTCVRDVSHDLSRSDEAAVSRPLRRSTNQ